MVWLFLSKHLYAPNTRKRLAGQLKAYVKSAPSTVLVILRLLKEMLKRSHQLACRHCGSLGLPTIASIAPDHNFKYSFLQLPQRGPPKTTEPITQKQQDAWYINLLRPQAKGASKIQLLLKSFYNLSSIQSQSKSSKKTNKLACFPYL